MKHYLITLKNGRRFGVLAADSLHATVVALEAIKHEFVLDDDKEIIEVVPLQFFHKNGRVNDESY